MDERGRSRSPRGAAPWLEHWRHQSLTPPSGSSIPTSKVSWTTVGAAGGTGWSGTLGSSSYALVFQSDPARRGQRPCEIDMARFAGSWNRSRRDAPVGVALRDKQRSIFSTAHLKGCQLERLQNPDGLIDILPGRRRGPLAGHSVRPSTALARQPFGRGGTRQRCP
jgi:hypothetical protein